MGEFLRSWILNITVMVVFTVLVEIVVPSDKFKKYVKLVTGLVLMIVIVNPIVTVINKDYSLDFLTTQSMNRFDKADLAANINELDEMQNRQIIEIYKQKLAEQVKEKILSINGTKDARVNISIDEDINSKTFGTVLGIEAVVYNSAESKAKTIKKIDISVSKQETEVSQNSEIKDNIKNILSKSYEVASEKINIIVQRNEKG